VDKIEHDADMLEAKLTFWHRSFTFKF